MCVCVDPGGLDAAVRAGRHVGGPGAVGQPHRRGTSLARAGPRIAATSTPQVYLRIVRVGCCRYPSSQMPKGSAEARPRRGGCARCAHKAGSRKSGADPSAMVCGSKVPQSGDSVSLREMRDARAKSAQGWAKQMQKPAIPAFPPAPRPISRTCLCPSSSLPLPGPLPILTTAASPQAARGRWPAR